MIAVPSAITPRIGSTLRKSPLNGATSMMNAVIASSRSPVCSGLCPSMPDSHRIRNGSTPKLTTRHTKLSTIAPVKDGTRSSRTSNRAVSPRRASHHTKAGTSSTPPTSGSRAEASVQPFSGPVTRP